MSEQLKSSVLAKCGELAPTEAEYHVHPKYNVRRVRQKVTIYADWGSVEFKESTPHDDDVWPIAAQILGIHEAKPTIDKSIYREIWWDGVRAQRDHKVYGNEDKALNHYLKFMNMPHVIEALGESD